MSGYHRNGYGSDQNSVGSQEENHYEVEHLATFTISPQAGLVYPSDGMRRLLQMEKTSGIWTQKMYLRLDASWVVIVDYENGEVVEKFPIHLIRDPTAFTSSDPKEIYDNIFVFIVGEDPATQNPPEMHIFQVVRSSSAETGNSAEVKQEVSCVRVNATVLVEEMKGFMTGVKKGSLPPPPSGPPPEPPNPVRNQLPPFGPPTDHRADDTSSTSSEKYERDVAVLNRCFDDIERFIARLQHAAAASRELDRRRTSRKSKKKDHGDGIMQVRARAPPEKDFIDTLQKFKLSFNLLAKLKSHIHDPNAPELVHFLFTPLALIVDASRDAQVEPNLPVRVISPLLTAEAVELLTNCLTSKETELWHSLGEAWLVPREKWKGYVTPYHPVFADGWAPDYPLIEEKDRPNERYFYDAERAAPSPVRRERSETPPSDTFRTSNRPGSDISGDSMERSGAEDLSERRQRLWVDELRKRDARIVQVTYPRTANNDKELTVVRGELLEVVDDSKNWWKCRNQRGQAAHVPHTIVTPYLLEDEIFQPYHQDPRPGPSTDWVKRERQGKKDPSSDESFSEDEDGLPLRSRQPKKTVPVVKPAPVVRPAPPRKAATAPPPISRKVESESDSDSSTMSDESEPVMQKRGRNDSDASQENMLEELRTAVLRDTTTLNIKKTSAAFMSEKSSASEVQDFLTAKGFSSDVKKKLRNKNGKDLFGMKNDDFVKLIGKEEGHRLESYIKIQKSITDYKTVRSSELKLALARARARAGVSRSPSPSRTKKPNLPLPKKLYDYDSGSGRSSPMANGKRDASESPPPVHKTSSRRREKSESPPPPRKLASSKRDNQAPPLPPPNWKTSRESSESPPPGRKSPVKKNGRSKPDRSLSPSPDRNRRRDRRDGSISPPAAKQQPRKKGRETSESPPRARRQSPKKNGKAPPTAQPSQRRREPSESPPRARRQSPKKSAKAAREPSESPPRARRQSPKKSAKGVSTAQSSKNTNGVAPKKKEEPRRPPPAFFDDPDSDDEPPAPGTLREQILKQRKRLSTVK